MRQDKPPSDVLRCICGAEIWQAFSKRGFFLANVHVWRGDEGQVKWRLTRVPHYKTCKAR
jgi:hypothetical protein